MKGSEQNRSLGRPPFAVLPELGFHVPLSIGIYPLRCAVPRPPSAW